MKPEDARKEAVVEVAHTIVMACKLSGLSCWEARACHFHCHADARQARHRRAAPRACDVAL